MMYSSFENTTFKDHQSHFQENFETLYNFSLKMCTFYNKFKKYIFDIVRNLKKGFSLLHLIGL